MVTTSVNSCNILKLYIFTTLYVFNIILTINKNYTHFPIEQCNGDEFPSPREVRTEFQALSPNTSENQLLY